MARLVGIDLEPLTLWQPHPPPYFYLGVINGERENRKEKGKAIVI